MCSVGSQEEQRNVLVHCHVLSTQFISQTSISTSSIINCLPCLNHLDDFQTWPHIGWGKSLEYYNPPILCSPRGRTLAHYVAKGMLSNNKWCILSMQMPRCVPSTLWLIAKATPNLQREKLRLRELTQLLTMTVFLSGTWEAERSEPKFKGSQSTRTVRAAWGKKP